MTGLEMFERWLMEAASGPEDAPALEVGLALVRFYRDEDDAGEVGPIVALFDGPAREPVTHEDLLAELGEHRREERLEDARARKGGGT